MFLNYVVEVENLQGRLDQSHYQEKDVALKCSARLAKLENTKSVIVCDAKTSEIIHREEIKMSGDKVHISDQVEKILSKSWDYVANLSGTLRMTKMVVGHKVAGEISDGSRLVTLEIDKTGRWFTSLDGWGKVEKEIDLRNFLDNPQGAIDAILKA